MRFAEPGHLAWLVPLLLGWAAGARLWARRRGGSAAVRYPSLQLLTAPTSGPRARWRGRLWALRALAGALLALALLRPQWGQRDRTVWSQGIDIVLAIDTSGSMQALDLDADKPIPRRRNRLEVVKQVMADFVARRENDQLGLVVFGTHAYTQCPLTLDHAMLATLIDQVSLGVAGDSTSLGTGLATAVARLQRSRAKSKVVVLLTDGRSNSGTLTPQQAADAARALKVKVYTVGAGAVGRAPLLVDTVFGKQIDYMDADLDEPTLKTIAETTGGAYFRAEDSAALARIYAQIDSLERDDIHMKTPMAYQEAFSSLVVPALLLLLLEQALLATWLRALP